MARKRKTSSSDNSTTKQAKSNPFLDHEVNAISDCHNSLDEDLLFRTNIFLDLNEQNEDEVDNKLSESVRTMVEYIETHLFTDCSADPKYTKESVASSLRTAGILLPWATKVLIKRGRNADHDRLSQCWQALSASFTILSYALEGNDERLAQSARNVLQQCITNKVLFKLVPLAAGVGVSGGESSISAVKCFQTMVHGRLSLTFDAAVKYLFLPILEDVAENLDNVPHTCSIMSATLHCLTKLLSKANQKTAFLVLSSREILLAFSLAYFYLDGETFENDERAAQCQTMIKGILSIGLFHPDHHLDGFRSLLQIRGVPDLVPPDPSEEGALPEDSGTKSSSFHCYQAELLKNLETLLEVPKSVLGSAHASVTEETTRITLTRLVPKLLEAFLEQLSKFGKKSKDSKKRNSSKSLFHQMQFAFFAFIASSLWRTVLESSCGTDSATVVNLDALADCLSIFLQHDAFVPSDTEEDMQRRKFLSDLTSAILASDAGVFKNLNHVLAIVERLMLLDYKLLHEELGRAISLAIGSPDVVYHLSTQALALLVTTLNTYKKLRQTHHLFQALLWAVSQSQTNEFRMGVLASLLAHPCIKKAFSEAIQESPSQEIKKIFLALDAWIAGVASQHETSDSCCASLSKVIKEIAGIVVSNVRVERNTAADVASFCQQVMRGSVSSLCKYSNESSEKPSSMVELEKLGLTLCGWVIDLQMRCAFWLGHNCIRENQIEKSIPANIRQLLLSTRLSTSSEIKKTIPEELFLLIGYRLQHLDYFIHEQRLLDSEELALGDYYVFEARQLAALMADSLDTPSMTTNSRWKQIAQRIMAWVPYAKERHLVLFLCRMFAMLAGVTVQRSPSTISVFPCRNVLSSALYNEERAVTLSLIKDASFFEIQELSELMSPCAISVVAEMVALAVSDDPPNDRGDDFDKQILLCPLVNHNWKPLKPNAFIGCLEWQELSTSKLNFSDHAPVLVDGALRLLKTINGFPLMHSASVALKCADSALRIESFCRRICGRDLKSLVPLISALRFFVSRQLSISGEESLNLVPTNCEQMEDILSKLQGATSRLLKKFWEREERDCIHFLFCTEHLTEAVLRCCMQSNDCSTLTGSLSSHIRITFASNKTENTEDLMCLVSHGKAILSSLHVSQVDNVKDVDTVLQLFSSWISKVAANSLCSTNAVLLQVYLFAGKLFKMIARSYVRRDSCSELLESAVSIMKDLEPFYSQDLNSADAEYRNAVLFMVSCFATTAPPSGLRYSLIDQLIACNFQSTWIDASVATLTRDMKGDALHSALSRIYCRIKDAQQNILRIFQVLIQVLNKDEQVQVLSRFAEEVFFKSVEMLSLGRCQSRYIPCTASLINEILQHKKLMSIKERHIALLLSQISAILGKRGAGAFSNVDGMVSDEIYSSCYSIFATLIQRFSKQLYTCVPSVTALLHSFQSHGLYGDMSDITAQDRGQKIGRLCELLYPHKDIYKKHVICLLLEFVDALGKDLCLYRKECHLPSIYIVLDMLSKYEMQQLNALMNTSGRILFRSVYQGYQKLHAYKGQ